MIQPSAPNSEIKLSEKVFPKITQEILSEYSKASGDYNPIHLDEEAAKKAGLPGVIAHGMLIAGYLSTYARAVGKKEGFELNSGSSIRFRFKAMTHLHDTPVVGGSIKSRDDQHLSLELFAKNQKDEITTLATVEFKKDL